MCECVMPGRIQCGRARSKFIVYMTIGREQPTDAHNARLLVVFFSSSSVDRCILM